MLLLLACVDPAVTPVTLGDLRPVSPRVAARGGWVAAGSSDLQLFGHDPDSDLGPLALLATEDGFALLDQENTRVLRYDAQGSLLGATPLPSRTTLDLAVDGGGWAALAYAPTSTTWSVQRLDASGALLATAPAAVDAPSGVFVSGDTVLVEQAHDRTLDVATGAWQPGRPAGNGWVHAEKEAGDRLLVRWYEGDTLARTTVVTPDRTLGNVISLDWRDGYTLLTLFLFEEGPAPDFELFDPELRVVLLDKTGAKVDELSLPPGTETITTRELALGPNGTLMRLRTDADGVALETVDLEGM